MGLKKSTLFCSPTVSLSEVLELSKEKIVWLYKMKDGIITSTDRKDISGTCHRVFVINGEVFCVDSIDTVEDGIIVITNRDNKYRFFKSGYTITEHPNPTGWLMNVWTSQ